jgi:hypothetical protein
VNPAIEPRAVGKTKWPGFAPGHFDFRDLGAAYLRREIGWYSRRVAPV